MAKGTAHQVASLVHAAINREQEEREQAERQYVKLIHANAGNADDVNELLRCATLLGKHSQQINADRATIDRAEQLADEIKSLAGNVTVETFINELHHAHFAEMEAQIARLKQQHFQQLGALQSSAASARGSAERHRSMLAELKQANPTLLAGVAIPTTDLDEQDVEPGRLIPEYDVWRDSHVELKQIRYVPPAERVVEETAAASAA